MANRTWTGGTNNTWDATTGGNWSGGVAPIAGDNITFDGTSGAATVTADPSIAGIAFGSLTAGAYGGGLNFNTNNPNMSFTTVNFSGTGARTINMGSGTWTLTGGSGTTPFDCGTTTSLTPTFQNASIVVNANATARLMGWGIPTGGYGAITISANSTKGVVAMTGATTLASLTVASGNTVTFTQAATLTITNALNMTGTASAPVGFHSANAQSNATTVSIGAASTIDWGSFLRVTKAGAGSFSVTNSFDLGGNTGITIGAPSVGGGVVGVIGG